jgi:outer membrane immunogenic protein
MKAILATAAAAAVIAMAAPAAAQTQMDASVGYSLTDAGDANLGAVTGRVGVRAGWLGAEGELSLGVGSDDVGAAKVKLDNQWAIYGKAIAPVSENFDVFARIGYGESRVETKFAGVSAKNTDNSVNYGAGAEWFFDANNGVRADYTRQDFDKGAEDANVWSLSYVRKF